MQLENRPPSREKLFWSGIADSRGVAAFVEVGRWLTIVRTQDPLRAVLNRGFAYVITAMTLIATLLALVFISIGDPIALVFLLTIPFLIIMWWLNRRGKPYGAMLYVLWCIIGIAVGMPPASYIGATTPIPLVFIFPVVAATLFIRPQAG